MKILSTLHILIMIILVSGSRSNANNKDTPYWETAEFWATPMSLNALDSIIEGRKHIIGDNGKPYPIDEYDMCVFRYGEPKNRETALDSIIGTWHGYGHTYDPRTILTLNPDSTYTLVIEDAEDFDESGNMTYRYSYKKDGKYTYSQKENRLTLLNYNDPESLTREAYMKVENPLNEVRIIYSIEKDTMLIFDGHCDLWPYYRQ